MTILVTGRDGQLGSELCRQLGDLAVGVECPEFDLTNSASVLATMRDIRPTAVVNTAAYTRVDRAESERDRCWSINVEGVACLADACRQVECRLIQISTDYVFDGQPSRNAPFRETDTPSPRGVYAQSKLESEKLAARNARHLIVRTGGLYGRPGPRSAGNFVESILRAASEGKPLRVVSDQQCTPTYVAHLARAIGYLLQSEASGLYHLTNSGQTTWWEFAREILQQTGLDVPVTPISAADWGAAAPRPAYCVLDCSKYHRLAGAPPMPPWRESLAEYMSRREGSEPGVRNLGL